MAEKNKSMDDVKDADKVAQSATSRPVVVGNSNEVVDSTIVEKSKKVIAPLTDEEKKATQQAVDAPEPEKESEAEKVEVKIDTPKTEEKEEVKDLEEQKEPEESEQPKDDKEESSEDKKEESPEKPEETASSDEGSAEVDALAGEVDAKRKEELANKEREDKLLKIEEKIESKEYFLPIKDSATSSRLGMALIILFVIASLVLGAGYYYMTTQQ